MTAGLIPRILDIKDHLRERSLFLFGPRQTGKSTFLRTQLGTTITKTYNLLDRGLFLRLSNDQTLIRQELVEQNLTDCVICIDEIQKLPELLDEVQLLIEERNIRFLLTGSSARKPQPVDNERRLPPTDNVRVRRKSL